MAAKTDAKTPPQTAPKKTADKSPLDSVQVTDRRIALWFGDRELTVEQAEACRRVRAAAAAFAQTIKSNVVGSPDQTAAIRQVREATDTAICGIKNGNL